MKSSNPYMGSLAKNQGRHPFAQQGNQGGYGQQGAYGQQGMNPYATSAHGGVQTAAMDYGMQNAANYGQAGSADRPMTVDDVVTKTGITLAVIIALAVVNFFIGLSNPGLAMVLTFVGMIGGLIAVLVSAFGKKYDSAPVTLTYAAFEGLFVGGFTFLVSGAAVGDTDAGMLIAQAVLGTIGVFIGMLLSLIHI